MISVDMSSLWSDEIEKIVQGVTEGTNNITAYCENPNRSQTMLLSLGDDIVDICDFWTGKTYVGNDKNILVKNAFQLFFETLMKSLLFMSESDRDYELRLANAMLYRGPIYRYLGNNYPTKNIVKPIYNNIYVSWSKNKTNNYIESKLYGTKTWLACEIAEPLYGIDLDAIGCSRANEREVVFPTIENCITQIEYIGDEHDE